MLLLHFHSPKFLANLSIIQNCLLHWLCDTAFYWTFIWSLRDLPPCDHGLWPLCGHLLTSALCDPLEPPHKLLPSEDVLGSELFPLKRTDPGHFLPSILWFQHHGSLHMWHSPPDTIAYTDSFLVHLLVAANRGVTPVINFVMLFVFYVVLLCFLRTHNSAGRKKPWLPIVLTSQLSCSLCLYFNVSVTCNNLFHE